MTVRLWDPRGQGVSPLLPFTLLAPPVPTLRQDWTGVPGIPAKLVRVAVRYLSALL